MAKNQLQNKKAIMTYILSNITKLANSAKDGDQRQLIMLVAAISLLNSGESASAVAAARRVAQLSMIKAKK